MDGQSFRGIVFELYRLCLADLAAFVYDTLEQCCHWLALEWTVGKPGAFEAFCSVVRFLKQIILFCEFFAICKAVKCISG